MGSPATSLATERVTITWQFSTLPNSPQYWRATPTERSPFLAMEVSSVIQKRTGPCASIAGSTVSCMAVSTAVSLHAPSDTKFSSVLCLVRAVAGASRAAIGSTLLRPSGQQQAGAVVVQRLAAALVLHRGGEAVQVGVEGRIVGNRLEGGAHS